MAIHYAIVNKHRNEPIKTRCRRWRCKERDSHIWTDDELLSSEWRLKDVGQVLSTMEYLCGWRSKANIIKGHCRWSESRVNGSPPVEEKIGKI